MKSPTRPFLEALACEAALSNIPGVPFDDHSTYRKLHRILESVRLAAATLLEEGNLGGANELLQIVEDLSPDSNTGVFDSFLARLRALQPTFAKVENPTQYSLRFDVDRPLGRVILERTPASLRSLAAECAAFLR